MLSESARGAVEKREKDPRFEIVRLWRERQVKWKSMENDQRLTPDQRDVETLLARKKEQRAGFGSEAVGMAEAMVMELLDNEGVTKPFKRTTKTGKVVREGYNFLASEGIVYPATELDDQLRGADVLLLMADPEQGNEASVFALDVTVDPNAIQNKIGADLFRVRESGENLNRVYWYDTQSDEPGEVFTEPKEGKVQAVNLSVFVPSEWANKYMSESTSADDARAVMERLGPFIVKQMRDELEVLGMRALGYSSGSRGNETLIHMPSTEELIASLEVMEERAEGRGRYAPRAIRIALQNILEAEDENWNRGYVLNPKDEKLLPQIMPGFTGLRRHRPEAAE